MGKQISKATTGLLILLVLAGALTRKASAQSASAISNLDLNRYMGTWYEIARLPDKAQKNCVSNGIILFALADKANRFQVVNSCQAKDGYTNVRNASGKPANKSGDGKLKVSYTWPFSQKYWVLAVDPSYEWVLVGSPNHKLLWVLSRTATLSPDVLATIEAKAATQGFATSKLIISTQAVPPAAE